MRYPPGFITTAYVIRPIAITMVSSEARGGRR